MNSLMVGPCAQTLSERHPWQIHEEELAGQWEDLCYVFAAERELQTCWPLLCLPRPRPHQPVCA